MDISLITMQPCIADKQKNISKMKSFLSQSSSDLFIFGESPITGYRCKDELYRLAEPLSGPTIQTFIKSAEEHDAYILFGMPIQHQTLKGVIQNSAVLIHPSGKVDTYQKWFLPNFGPFEEKIYFDEGERLPVFSTSFGNIGICICYDLFFPELAKMYSLQGADYIVCISSSPNTSRKLFETLLPARAIENTVYFIFTNIVGTQEDLVFWGGSQIYGPLGDQIIKAPYFEESIVSTTLDLSEIELVRPNRPTLRDTRSNLFYHLYEITQQR